MDFARRRDDPFVQVGVIVLEGEQEGTTKGVDLHDVAVDVVGHHDEGVLLGV